MKHVNFFPKLFRVQQSVIGQQQVNSYKTIYINRILKLVTVYQSLLTKCQSAVYINAVSVIKHLPGITQESGINKKLTTQANQRSVHIVMQLFQDAIIFHKNDTIVMKKDLLLVKMMATNVKFVRKSLPEKILFKSIYPKCTVGKGTVVPCVLLPLPKALS